jgi:hypothetical protein
MSLIDLDSTIIIDTEVGVGRPEMILVAEIKVLQRQGICADRGTTRPAQC